MLFAIIFVMTLTMTPMYLNEHLKVAESFLMRRNTHMRSLFIEYPRMDTRGEIVAALTNRHHHDVRFKLPVIHANHNGISLKLPTWVTGMFELSIQDGNQRISRRIALQ